APRVTMTAKSDIETPRMREYFPETLLWQPEIQTDAKGRAQLRFKLADNITTWKLSLIGSTIDGQIGTVEKEIRAFMPFFAELDPPKVLTEGDEISLPVVLRNYLDKAQSVDLQMKAENWFSLLGPSRKRTEVQSNDSVRETFDFRAVASVKNGKQRVTAISTSASDAIEKPVNVHPDGEELAQTSTRVFDQAGTLEINVPDYAIKNTPHAELKIYPNLMAHLLEGIEGILQRPYGCGEQTISSTYPNVMALKYLKSNPSVPASREKAIAALKARAEKYAQAGYERLLGYRAQGGGFTYWGRGETDLALTAYALRFLNDAREVISVDDKVIEETRDWLVKQQQSDGRWPAHSWWDKEEQTRRTMMNTAIIARSVARSVAVNELKRKTQNTNVEDAKSLSSRLAMSRAFDYLAARTAEIDEPYAIAAYALAAIEAGKKERTAWAIEKLRTLARDEAGGAYWNLETNTPFYGWGTAGRVETSALAVKALALGGEERDKELIGRGLHFLMRNKDRYGVWYSTQATINVLDAFITLNALNPAGTNHETTAEIFVNNRRATSVVMPPSNQFGNPITVDLSPYLSIGTNRVEIKRSAEGALATAQVVETHYIPWTKSAATQSENFRPGTSSAMRLVVNFDKTEAKVGDEITCHVEAERIGYSGYGMMLAEIGLPPGAEVQRESLEKAVKEAGWSVSQYDVLPDRVILYLWPRAGGTTCEFKFKTRFGIKALSSASTLYDYYNPEARAIVEPMKFVVK
ncbi:MAG TPA: alpha-2-macroglobulin family protein, partial [Blastocatellia bacterium]|nr:alpha-2-macroglobulin family protein [Blastocatellia bacterium]